MPCLAIKLLSVTTKKRNESEIQKQQMFYLNENKMSDMQSNQNLLTQLESQQALIISMKTKLNEQTATAELLLNNNMNESAVKVDNDRYNEGYNFK